MNIKTPPHSKDAEQWVIASVLLDEDYSKPFIIGYNADIFYVEAHKKILKTMQELIKENIRIEVFSVSNRNKDCSADYLLSLLEEFPTAKNIKHYISVIEEQYNMRKIIIAAGRNMKEAYSGELKTEDFLKRQKTLVDSFSVTDKKEFNLKQEINKALTRIEDKQQMGYPTGYQKLDATTGGLIPGDLIIIGGLPSMGKTALSVCMASSLIGNNKKVLFFSMEMSIGKILNRIFSIRAEVPLWLLKGGKELKKEQWKKLQHTGGYLVDQPLIIDDRPALSVWEIHKKAYTEHLRGSVEVIFIDYLQRMKHNSHKSGNRAYEVGETVVSLKSLAKELNIPIVLLAQLNREIRNRPNPEPRMSDLRESGDIENEADLILFPFRPSELKKTDEKETKKNYESDDKLIIGKHRDGAKGAIRMEWTPEFAMFEESPY